MYIRPRGAPGGREGGGTRGPNGPGIAALISEDHAAYIPRAAPKLYWHLVKATDVRIDFILNRDHEEQSLLEHQLPGPFQAGIQVLDLSSIGVRLDPGSEYRWYVQATPNPERTSQNVYSGGTLLRVKPSTDLLRELESAAPDARATIYARQGIWCDAFDAALSPARGERRTPPRETMPGCCWSRSDSGT